MALPVDRVFLGLLLPLPVLLQIGSHPNETKNKDKDDDNCREGFKTPPDSQTVLNYRADDYEGHQDPQCDDTLPPISVPTLGLLPLHDRSPCAEHIKQAQSHLSREA